MFTEILDVRQVAGEPMRRWFIDEELEIILWLGSHDRIVGFQLCYESDRQPKALTWQENDGFLHSEIDDGESRPGRHKASPILIPDGTFDEPTISRRFERSCGGLPVDIAAFVKSKIAEYKAGRHRCQPPAAPYSEPAARSPQG